MMATNNDRDGERRSVRLPLYDYSADGMYFVTVCTCRHVCLFGDVERGIMVLNDIGQIVASTWREIVDHFPGVTLDEWIVMPNHVHGIVVLRGVRPPVPEVAVAAWRARHLDGEGVQRRTPPRGPAQGSLGAIIGSFKSAATKRVNALRRTPEAPVSQRGYHERVIDRASMLTDIRRYIATNPRRWSMRDVGRTPECVPSPPSATRTPQ